VSKKKKNNIEEINNIFKKLSKIKDGAKKLSAEEIRKKSELINEIAIKYKPLVMSIAYKYRASPFYEDLIQEGMIALMRHIEKFDKNMSNDFSFYAKKRIMTNMRRYSDKNSSADGSGMESDNEISTAHESDPEYMFYKKEIKRIVDGLPDKLKSVIYMRFGLDDKNNTQTLNEIGDELGITRERVRQIQNKALSILKKRFTEQQIVNL